MSQESLKYLINSSYVMLVSLLIPSHFTILQSTVGTLLWIHGMGLSSGYAGIWWIYQIKSSGYIWFQVICIFSTLLIIFISISTFTIGRIIKKRKFGKNLMYQLIGIIIFMQGLLIFLNFFMYFPFIPYFGYLAWIFALILVVKAKKAL